MQTEGYKCLFAFYGSCNIAKEIFPRCTRCKGCKDVSDVENNGSG
jgi:hypothetical protein